MSKNISVFKYRFSFPGTFVILVGLIVLTSCGALRNDGSNNINNFSDLQELVESREFEIEYEWALPLRGSRINLIGNPNHIRFEGDSVDIFLPYFGVRQMGGGYGREGGIRYEGPINDLEVVENPENRNVVLKFEGNQRNENLQFFITIFENGRSNANVSSSQRDAISYQGFVRRKGTGE